MRRPGLRKLKWLTFAVALTGVTALHAALSVGHPSGPLDMAARAFVLVASVLAFNEYAFVLVARRDALLDLERERLYALHQISRNVALLPAWERNLRPSLEILRRVMGADLAAWVEPTPEGGAVCRAAAGPEGPGAVSAGLVGRALRETEADLLWQSVGSGRILAVEDGARLSASEADDFPLLRAEGLRAAAAVGAGVHDPLGAVVVGWRAAHACGRADQEFLENVGNLLGVAAENLRLYRETQRVGALEERERIAREMHDGLAQALTYLKLKAEAALAGARPGTAPALESALRAIRKGAVDALGDVRQALLDLKSPVHPGEDLRTALGRQVRAWSQLNDIPADVRLPADPVALAPEAEAQVLRIVQEALANVRKHAAAKRVSVRLASDEGGLAVAIADDGRGFDVDRTPGAGHYGIGNLHERAAAVGGTLHIASSPGGGTEVVLQVPAPAAEVREALAVASAGRGP